jgi:plastocyanin
MQTRKPLSIVLRFLVVGAALGLVVGACGSDDDGDTASGSGGDDTTSTTEGARDVNEGDEILIDDFTFGDGQPVEVEQGKNVVWKNDDSVRHTITDDTDNPAFSSDAVQPGDTFTLTFDEPGTFQYHCSIHPDRMRGELVITPAS